MSILGILLMLAMLATLSVLFLGIGGFVHGGSFNERYGNRLMQARVGLQLVAIILLGLMFFAHG